MNAANPLDAVRTYTPSPKQGAFHACGAKYRLLLGAWGSGKTKMLIWEDIMLALEFPGSLGVIYRKTYPALRDTTKRDYMAEAPPELIANEVRSEGREEIEWINGSRTLFRCLDDYRKLGSTQFDRISIDEAWEVSEDEFRTLAFGRMRGKIGPRRMILASNPPNRDTWMYKFFVVDAADDTAVFHYSTYDNKDHLPADYIARLEKMPDLWKKKFLFGDWGIMVSGSPVFSDFREDLHVVKGGARPIPGIPILRGWDFGFRHPGAVWVQIAPTGHVFILGEQLGEDIDLVAFGQRVMEESQRRWPYAQFEDYCDVAGTQSNDRGPSAVAILRSEFGLFPRYRKMSIWQGIERLRYLLRNLSAGRPLLQFDPGCRLLIDAFAGGYVMDPNNTETVKDLPKKDGYYDHLIDALRYAVTPAVMPASSPYAGKPFPRTWRPARALGGSFT